MRLPHLSPQTLLPLWHRLLHRQTETLSLAGLDVSTSAVKWVELGKAPNGQIEVLQCLHEPLGRDWIVDGQIEKFDEVAQVIKKVVRKSGSRTRRVAMAIPAAAVITKKVILPKNLDDAMLEAQVSAEASQYIPFPLNEVSLDYCTLGEIGNEEIEVLIVASRKEKIQDRQALAEAAGLNAIIMDVESYAARLSALHFLAASEIAPTAVVAIFEMGAHLTRLHVMRGEVLLYERDQPFGSEQLTQMIAREFSYSEEEAETQKRQSKLPVEFSTTLLPEFIEQCAQEVARALQFFFTSTPHNQVDQIFLSGGGAMINGLTQAIHAKTSQKTGLLDPFHGMQLSGPQPKTQERLAYLRACGLALRRFDEVNLENAVDRLFSTRNTNEH